MVGAIEVLGAKMSSDRWNGTLKQFPDPESGCGKDYTERMATLGETDYNHCLG